MQPARATIISIIVSVIGGSIIGYGDFATDSRALLGDLLAVIGAICAAFYLLLGRRLRPKLSLLSYVAICYGSAALFLWLAVIALQLPVSGFNTQTVAAFWAMALVSQIIGHSSYNWALRWFSTGLIAVALLGEPIGSTIMAYFIFDEGLNLSVDRLYYLRSIWQPPGSKISQPYVIETLRNEVISLFLLDYKFLRR